MLYGRLRWLEPMGQVIAFLAFSIQFFYVDPASYGALRAALEVQSAQIEGLGIKNGTQAGNAKEARDLIARLDAAQSAKALKDDDDARKQKWKFWLFLTFMIGAFFTIAGKAASVRYSTKTNVRTTRDP